MAMPQGLEDTPDNLACLVFAQAASRRVVDVREEFFAWCEFEDELGFLGGCDKVEELRDVWVGGEVHQCQGLAERKERSPRLVAVDYRGRLDHSLQR